MKLPDSFLDELRARTPLVAVIGRRVKLARSGRQHKGCCPFHGEKSPSFYVYEDHYHCFGCGEHGDAVGFVMKSQGASFMEAVEQLAGEAGLEVPKPSPQAVEQERLRADLYDVLAGAERFYQDRLRAPEGAAALDYLRGRGLEVATIARFGLGWSGDGRGGLASSLAAIGATRAQLAEAGLLRLDEDGNPGRELFYNRVMFPIRDRRGRVISFGGRIMGVGQPKYVNGPESPLFSKRRQLYGLDFAREAARAGEPVVVVEGYMDVIALHQAGFGGAVAPLGTALTEEQLAEIWRLSPVPVLCFDGDAAGGRAAVRAADLALPHLAPDRSLRIATLPAGQDPDTLVRSRGKAGFDAVLQGAPPFSEVFYTLLAEGTGSKTPEQRAALRNRLVEAAAKIGDKSLAGEYRRALLDRFFASGRRGAAPVVRRAARPALDESGVFGERVRTLTLILVNHPDLLHDLEEAFATLSLPPELSRLREALFSFGESSGALDSAGLIDHFHTLGLSDDLARLTGGGFVLPSYARPEAQKAEAASGWWHIFGLMHRATLEEEVNAAQRAFDRQPDDTSLARLNALLQARDRLRRGAIGGGGMDDAATQSDGGFLDE